MIQSYSVLMQKVRDGAVLKDSVADFGFVCTSVSMPDMETKELYKNEWKDEDGDDVYASERMMMKSYAFEIGIAFRSRSGNVLSKMDDLLDYLTGYDGSGTEMMVYVPHDGMGRSCFLQKVSGVTVSRDSGEELLEAKLTMYVCNPRSRVSMYEQGVGGVLKTILRDRV